MVRPGLNAETSAADTDLYVLLNSTRDADPEDLRLAYRRLSQLYHPDKHVDPTTKQAATDRFTLIKEAYEILRDDKLRRIYDEFGLEAAREAASPALELTPYLDLVNRFRQDGASGSGAGGAANAPRDAYFTVVNAMDVRIDGTGLVVALEDGLFADAPPLAVVMQVGFSSIATAYVSQDTTVLAQYNVNAGSARSHPAHSAAGDLSVAVRHQLSPYSQAEITAHVPLEKPRAVTYGFKAVRSLDKFMQMSIESAYDPRTSDATTSLSVARSFSERHSATLSWATGTVPGVMFQWRRDAYDEYLSDGVARKKAADDEEEDEEEGDAQVDRGVGSARLRALCKVAAYVMAPVGWRWSLRVGPMSAVDVIVRRPIGSAAPLFGPCAPSGPGGASVKVRARAGLFGWEIEAGGAQRFVLNDTAWGMAVACGSRGVVWKLKVMRGGHRLQLPVVLVSSTADARTATLAAIASSLVVSAVQSLVLLPMQRRREAEERAEAKLRRKEVMERARDDARRARELIERQVKTAREREEAVEIGGRRRSGLIVARAVYGRKEVVCGVGFEGRSFEGREIEEEVIEVGECVQALVENSQVQVVSTTKSTLMGFWDPSAFGEKEELSLRIWYWFRGEMHECVVDDMEPLELPLSNHKVRRWL